MGLTSPALIASMGVLAAAALAAVVWFWPRLSGHGAVPVLLRIGALTVLQLSVIGFVFLLVNSSAEFYSSWSDLLGTQSGGGAITARPAGGQVAGAGQQAAPVTVLATSPVAVAGDPRAAGGELQAVRFHGQLSGLTVPGYVYLPAGYGPRSALPVAVVISGQLGNAASAYSPGRLAATTARQIAARDVGPLIVVMLPDAVGSRDDGCLNVPGGAQATMFFTEDLPQAVGSAYRAISPAARRWVLVGDSAGGYCALQLALTNSGTFAAAAVPPGGYTAPPGPAETGGSPQIRTQDDLSWLIGHQPMQSISVLFTGAGPAEPFLGRARPPMRAGQIGLVPGRWELAGVLDWVGSALQQPVSSRS